MSCVPIDDELRQLLNQFSVGTVPADEIPADLLAQLRQGGWVIGQDSLELNGVSWYHASNFKRGSQPGLLGRSTLCACTDATHTDNGRTSAFTTEGEMLVSKSRIRRRTVFVSILAVILIVPIAAYGGSVFDDVADTDAHATGIEWMKSVGVTAGCGNNNYCPDRSVTRAEMATFMYRLSSVVDSDGYSVFHDAAVAIPGATILTLANIPAGSYVFMGKTTFNNGGASSSSASCKLIAGGQFDQVRATVAPFNWVPASFTVVNTFAGNGNSVTLECVGFSGVTANDTKITAIEVNALSNSGG